MRCQKGETCQPGYLGLQHGRSTLSPLGLAVMYAFLWISRSNLHTTLTRRTLRLVGGTPVGWWQFINFGMQPAKVHAGPAPAPWTLHVMSYLPRPGAGAGTHPDTDLVV